MEADRVLATGLLAVYAFFRTVWELGWLAGVFAWVSPGSPWYPFLQNMFPLWSLSNALLLVPLMWITIADVWMENEVSWLHAMVPILAVIYLVIAIPVWLINGSSYLASTSQFFTTNMFVDMPGIAIAAIALVYYLVD